MTQPRTIGNPDDGIADLSPPRDIGAETRKLKVFKAEAPTNRAN
jgi:hypothetical protein